MIQRITGILLSLVVIIVIVMSINEKFLWTDPTEDPQNYLNVIDQDNNNDREFSEESDSTKVFNEIN